MPRNAAGVYSLPEPAVVPDTTIEANDENSTRSDMATELTNSLDRNGRGGMLAPFRIADGLVATPGLAFLNEINSGLYRAGANDVRLAIAGVDVMKWLPGGVTIPQPLTLQTVSNSGMLDMARYTNDTASTHLEMRKSRGVGMGVHGILIAGDDLGLLRFYGSDGVTWIEGARLAIELPPVLVPAVGFIPARFQFYTRNAANAFGVRLTIDEEGRTLLHGVATALAIPAHLQGVSDGAVSALYLNTTSGSLRQHIKFGVNSVVSGGIGTAGPILVLTTNDITRLAIDADGRFGFGTANLNTGAGAGGLTILKASAALTTTPANTITVYGKDASAGATTLAVRGTSVEAIGTFTPANKVRIWWNEIEYWIQLDPVV